MQRCRLDLQGGRSKKLAENSERYLTDLRRIGGNFARRFPNKLVADVTPEDVEEWVAASKHCATTRNNRLRTLSSAFSLAVRRKWCESNPVDRIERAYERKPVAGYLSAQQTRCLLEHTDPDLAPYIAIQLLAGLRPCEVAELRFENINLEDNLLWVDKEEHTTSHRVVQIMPNLREWLLPCRSRTGKVRPTHYWKRWTTLRQKVGLYENGRTMVSGTRLALGISPNSRI